MRTGLVFGEWALVHRLEPWRPLPRKVPSQPPLAARSTRAIFEKCVGKRIDEVVSGDESEMIAARSVPANESAAAGAKARAAVCMLRV